MRHASLSWVFRAPASRLAIALLYGWALAASCAAPAEPRHVALSVKAADKQPGDIPAAKVAGKLRGKTFALVDARVRIEEMEGRERVDILLSDVPIERCGLPLSSGGRRVWLRWPGRPRLDGAPVRVEAGQPGPIEVHYELQRDGRWIGHGGGAALLLLRDEGFGKYLGKLWACFDDGEGSCVAGTFSATACRSELDVDDSVWGASRLDRTYPRGTKE